MTQDDYKLWTGESLTYSEEDWSRLLAVASKRLASLLCLEELPTPLPDDLAMLLANFICAVLRFEGNGEQSVSSKTIRSFTISFNSPTAVNAFNQVSSNYGDIIGEYSACGFGFTVEKNMYRCPYDGF